MTNRQEFIEREILPTLGEYADDYDIDGIVDDVSEFHPVNGYVWGKRFDEMQPLYFEPEAYWEIVARHDTSASLICPACKAVNSVRRARPVSYDAAEVVLEVSCCQCGTVWHRYYKFEQEEF